ncbi:hypothetical protein PSY31_22045, partial [Shigella flexneri]|nr:hypothetical protein [Shigella flexneri]
VKLKRLKKEMRRWNKEVYGDIFQNLRESEDKLLELEATYDHTGLLTDRMALNKAQAVNKQMLIAEEIFSRQKSRIKWLKEGDSNTAFFHRTVQVARQRQNTHKLKNDMDDWVDTPEGVASLLVDHFQAVLSTTTPPREDNLIQHIPKLITSEMNQQLCTWPAIDETKKAVFSMAKDSAPGPDGFSG